ncbi:MAG TPA: hypothetical protein VFZ61_21435 [Polyangiales bacterium]
MLREASNISAHRPQLPNAGFGPGQAFALNRRGRAQAALSMFVGKWQVRGYNEPITLEGRRTEVAGFQEYEWMPGRFFLSGRWDHRFGDGTHRGLSVLGIDPEYGDTFAHHYDNLGYARQYKLELHERVWTFQGDSERATYEFDATRSTYRELWELTRDGESWRPLCVLEALRLV